MSASSLLSTGATPVAGGAKSPAVARAEALLRDRDLLDRALGLLGVVVGRAAEVGREVRRAVPFA